VLLDLELPDDPLDDVIRKLLVAPARIIGISDRLSSMARTRAEGTGVALVLVRPIDCLHVTEALPTRAPHLE
jgi:hypothetical protein